MRFALIAVDPAKNVSALEIDAVDETAAADAARQRGLEVLSLSRKGAVISKVLGGNQRFPVAVFSIELLALLDAGLNVVEALQTLAERDPAGDQRRVLSEILEALNRGLALSDAINAIPSAFPPLYVATVRSSERTGNLKDALARYVAYQEQVDKVRNKVVGALIYPAILSLVGVAVIGFLLLYVVPRFAHVYEGLSVDLPLFSALLLATGRWIEHNRLLIAGTACGLAAGAAYCALARDARVAVLRLIWRLPALGERMRVYQLARLYRTLAMLLKSGIPALRALEMAAGLLHAEMESRLARARDLVREGHPMSFAFTSSGLATSVAMRMMVVAERSGQMGESLDRIARFCDDETNRFIDRFMRVFEPLLMVLLGIAVGGIVVLMYMPVFELAGSIQ